MMDKDDAVEGSGCFIIVMLLISMPAEKVEKK